MTWRSAFSATSAMKYRKSFASQSKPSVYRPWRHRRAGTDPLLETAHLLAGLVEFPAWSEG
jgi:hypothetical protein